MKGELMNLPSILYEGSDEGDGDSIATGSQTARIAGSRAARVSPRRVQPTSRAEYEAAKRRKEHAAKRQLLEEARREDVNTIQQRWFRAKQLREERLEESLEKISAEDHLRVEAAKTIRNYDVARTRKREDLYDKWDTAVGQRIVLHLSKYMTRSPQGGPPGFREELLTGDCPLKQALRDQHREESFHRTAASVLAGSPRQELKERVRQREIIDEEVKHRARCRPVLPIEMCEQRQHHASPFGYFSQCVERGHAAGGFHSVRRMGTGAHRIDESDGVLAAGKTKARFQRNQLGMLEGTLAKEGEAARYKTDQGASSGAPCQDHYHYEQGISIVDAEFPVGKRTYPFLHC